MGCPIRKSTDQRLLAASRGLSQLAASFIACWHQGIHRIALSSLITKVNSTSCILNLAIQNTFVKKTQRIVVIYALISLPMCSCQRTPANPTLPKVFHPESISNQLKKLVLSTNEPGIFTLDFDPGMVGLTGLEPVTLRLSSACSNQLSYRPKIISK